MIISHNELGINIKVENFQPLVLVVERKKTLVKLIEEIKLAVENLEEAFIVSDNEKRINLAKEAAVIIDPWNLDCNSKEIKTKLYKLLLDISNEQNFDKFIELKSNMFQYVEQISEHIPYELTYNMQIEPSAIFKCMEIGISIQESVFLEKVVEYMKLLQSLCRIKVLFLINMKSYITEEQVQLLYTEAEYINMQLVLVESSMTTVFPEEKVVVIDEDDCIIYI